MKHTHVLCENVITEQLTSRCAPCTLEKRMLADGSFETLPLREIGMEYPVNEPIGGTAPEEAVMFDYVGEKISIEDFMAQL